METYCQQILVIPIPLYRRRLNWRSYNQSELLAEELAKEFNLKIDKNILKREKYQIPQAELKDKAKRIENSKNIFSCRERQKIAGQTIILVDDVATTGSTLDEGAKVLKESGAEKVIGLVIAKG